MVFPQSREDVSTARMLQASMKGSLLLAVLLLATTLLLLGLSASAEPYEPPFHMSFEEPHQVFNATYPSVTFSGTAWVEANDTVTDWPRAALRLEDGPFYAYSFSPDVLDFSIYDETRVQLTVYVPDHTLAGTYDVDVLADVFLEGSHQLAVFTGQSLEIPEQRRVEVEYIFGTSEPSGEDGEYIARGALLTNTGNTVEDIYPQLLCEGRPLDVRFWCVHAQGSVGSTNPVRMEPGEHLGFNFNVMVDQLPAGDGEVSTTLEVRSSEDGVLLDATEVGVFPERTEGLGRLVGQVPLIVAVAAAVVATIVAYWQYWLRKR